jgi:uncharacterized protein YbjQ (UPF0145 family)
MKSKDICKQYNFNVEQFEKFLTNSGFSYKNGFLSIIVEDSDVPSIVSAYNEGLLKIKKLEEEKQAAELEAKRNAEIEAAKKKKALAEMLITSGFNFDGYTIKKYSGYISGDDCVTIERNTFWEGKRLDEELCPALVKIRRQAIKELKEAAYNLGCNAVIGVDFDYLTMDPQHSGFDRSVTVYEPYVICVTANGNAVVIEKDE